MKKTISIFLLVILACLAGCNPGNESTRGRDPWVFRINLDDHARSIVLALNDVLWAAYDPDKGGLYKVWKGGVRFRGPVFDLLHRVQPVSMGVAYMLDSLEQSQWRLKQNDQETIIRPEYRGYTWKDNRVTLRYILPLENGEAIRIEETPEYVTKDGRPGLERVIKTENVPDGVQILLTTAFEHLTGPDDLQTDGQFIESHSAENSYQWGKSLVLSGKVALNPNGITVIRSYFEPKATAHVPIAWNADTVGQTVAVAENMSGKNSTPASGEDLQALAERGKMIIGNSDCAACHAISEAYIGPAYTRISRRYGLSKDIVEKLSAKVIAGGSGVWGTRVMPPHANLSKSDASAMVAYILSMTPDDQVEPQPGVVVDYYDIGQPLKSLPTVVPGQNPNVSRVYPVIDFESGNADLGENRDENFAGFRNNFVMHVTGFLNIDREDTYEFLLAADNGAMLSIADQVVIDEIQDEGTGRITLTPGAHPFRIEYFQFLNTKTLFLGWRTNPLAEFELVPATVLTHSPNDVKPTSPGKKEIILPNAPGFGAALEAMHPSFDLMPLRPEGFNPRVGGIDFLEDGRMVICTWDGEVFIISGQETGDPDKVTYHKFAGGLAEPLGIAVADNEIYVIQRWELTKLMDHDGDGVAEDYRVVCDDWKTTADFHEWSFGLLHRDGYFYANLGIAQGRFYNRQAKDKGTTIKIHKDGSYSLIAFGLRAPNGIGFGVDGEIFATDNEGTWVPANKLIHIPDNQLNFYGSRSVIGLDTLKDLKEKPPVVWLVPQEIGNSPSQPTTLDVGPYKGQMIHGDITHGGIKRDFVEKIKGQYQGVVFRFAHGFEAGVNRIARGPDGALYVGGLGSAQDYGWQERQTGLERMVYNGKSTFEMLAIRAKSNGMEIEFTEPLRVGDGTDPRDYFVRQWYYDKESDETGTGKFDLSILKVRSVTLSEDRRKAFLEIPGRKPGHVLYFRLESPFLSVDNQQIWSNEAWYTLNEIPDTPGKVEPYPYTKKDNTLDAAVLADGWQLRFNGKNGQGWQGLQQNGLPAGWKIGGGELIAGGSGSVLLSEKPYENFELEWQWKISRRGAGGVYFAVSREEVFDPISLRSPRMQMIDDRNHPDAKHLATHLSGANYDLEKPRFRITRPAGEYNYARLVVNNGRVEHWLNGIKLLSYELGSEAWKAQLKGSIYETVPEYGQSRNGFIAFQCNSGEVALKNIRIRELALPAE